jgi:hypothetical protein
LGFSEAVGLIRSWGLFKSFGSSSQIIVLCSIVINNMHQICPSCDFSIVPLSFVVSKATVHIERIPCHMIFSLHVLKRYFWGIMGGSFNSFHLIII